MFSAVQKKVFTSQVRGFLVIVVCIPINSGIESIERTLKHRKLTTKTFKYKIFKRQTCQIRAAFMKQNIKLQTVLKINECQIIAVITYTKIINFDKFTT